MNILLINISLRFESEVKLFPVGLGYIATSINKAGFNLDVLDIDAHRFTHAEILTHIAKKKYDVVCMGCIVTGYKIVKELSWEIKRIHPNVKIIVGNSVATSVTDTILKKTNVDIAVMGEGDITIVKLLRAINDNASLEDVMGICFLSDGEVAKTPPRPVIKQISDLPFIDFSLFDIEIYIENSCENINEPLPIPRKAIRALPVNTARGCIGNCTFCYHNFRGVPYRYRTPDSIIGEVKSLIDEYGINYIHFWDELTFFSKQYTIEFMEKTIKSGVKFFWRGNCRADLFDQPEDLEIIKKMKQAGCIGISYSLESADASILKDMNKHITTEQFSFQTSLFHEAKIPVWTSLVFGYPQETPDTIKKTLDCCIQNKIYPSAGYLLPQPGSKMYEYAFENGHIRDEEEYLKLMGDRQDLRINMTAMTDEKFQQCVFEGLEKCNRELNIGLESRGLIKTKHYRGK